MSLKKFFHLFLILLVPGMSLFFVSCQEDEVFLGDWYEGSDFNGKSRSEAVCFLIDDKAYVGTGIDQDLDRLKDFWVFDPLENNGLGGWTRLAPMPDEAITRSGAVAFAAGGKGYVGTGVDDDGNELKDFWCYDPETNTWSAVENEFPGDIRFGAVAFSLNGHGYVGTGYNDDDGELNDFFSFDPATGLWTSVGYPGSKRRDACVFIIDNTAYFVGGTKNGTNSSALEDDFYSYNEKNGWVKLRKISDDDDDEDFDDDYTTIKRTAAVAFSIHGKGYLATGSSGSSIDYVWEYNPTTDLWNEKTRFQGGARTEAVGFAIGDYGYIATGKASTSYLHNDMAIFDPNAEDDEDYD
jgi:N-acetylneuraminic acid mutarotase